MNANNKFKRRRYYLHNRLRKFGFAISNKHKTVYYKQEDENNPIFIMYGMDLKYNYGYSLQMEITD